MNNLKAVVQELQSQKAALEKQVRAIDLALSALGGKDGRGGHRNLSAAARERIAAAQRKRWAAWKKAKQK